jgi:HEPN domain-containing protein
VNKKSGQWIIQANDDIEVAEILYKSKKFLHAIFICHLAVEKALKAIYADIYDKIPPKTHNLIYLVEITKLALPSEKYECLALLNEAGIPTRYPEDRDQMLKEFTSEKVSNILDMSKGVITWITEKLNK